MIKLLSLTIQGFRSFDGEQSVDFSKFHNPGFYFLTGVNYVERELGANGVGKSSLFEAMVFCLYGKTSSNLKAGSIGNWSSDRQCKVTLSFEKLGKNYMLRRTWNPNSLDLLADDYGREIGQDDVDKLIGINFTSFLYSTFIGQFNTKFFDLSPADKLQIFTEILDLDRWLGYSEKSKKISDELNTKYIEMDKQLEGIKGQLQVVNTQDFAIQIDSWEQDCKLQLKELSNKYDIAINAHTKLQGEINVLRVTYGGSKRKEDTIKNVSSKYINQLRELENKHLVKDKELTRIDTLQKQANKELDELTKLSGNVCPTCKQSVSKSHIKMCSEVVFTKIQELIKDKSIINVELNKVKEEIKEVDKKLDIVDKQLNKVIDEVRAMDKQLGLKNKDLVYLAEQMVELERQYKGLEGKVNPYIELQKETKKKAIRLERFIEVQRTELDDLSKEKEIYKYWQSGFKEVRLMVVEEMLKEFEISINNNVRRLGLWDWEVKLQVDSETKAGTIRKGFVVFIKSPKNQELVPFECWSGGESQRLRLAGTMGLMDLINSRNGGGWNVEVWDEPTQWLSDTGISAVLDVLKDRAWNNKKQTWLIDHRDLHSYGGFDGIVEIMKEGSGSKIYINWNISGGCYADENSRH